MKSKPVFTTLWFRHKNELKTIIAKIPCQKITYDYLKELVIKTIINRGSINFDVEQIKKALDNKLKAKKVVMPVSYVEFYDNEDGDRFFSNIYYYDLYVKKCFIDIDYKLKDIVLSRDLPTSRKVKSVMKLAFLIMMRFDHDHYKEATNFWQNIFLKLKPSDFLQGRFLKKQLDNLKSNN